ncbi:MAG: methyltransferase domain-containing protein [Xanthobacteraceae bacterium]
MPTRIAMLTRRRHRIAYLYHHPDNSTFRYRVYNMIQALNELSSDVSAAWFCLADGIALPRIVELCDVLVVSRLQFSSLIGRLINRAKQRGCRVIFDVDDLVFNPIYVEMIISTLQQDCDDSQQWDFWYAYTGRIKSTLDICDRAIATNAFLAKQIEDCSGIQASVVPNFMNAEQLAISSRIYNAKRESRFRRNNRLHIGYFSGSPSHDKDFAIVASALGALLDENPSIMVRLVGYAALSALPARHRHRIEVIPFTDFLNLQILIGETEINIVPLQNNIFTNCKSNLKFFEAGIVGTITVAAPTYAYGQIIQNGVNGFLSGEHEWGIKLRAAIKIFEDADDGHISIAEKARIVSEEKYSYIYQLRCISNALFDSTNSHSHINNSAVEVSNTIASDGEIYKNQLPREKILLSLFNFKGAGLEIGPGFSPLLPKIAGFNVETLDYTDRDELIKKYAGNKLVDINRIEEVDYVTAGRPILDVIQARGTYDYIVASHVIEHVPDFINFINSCSKLLKVDGLLVLAAPDKRYCFDMFQPISSTGEILQAYIERRDRPSPGKVFDSVAYDVLRSGLPSWGPEEAGPLKFNQTLSSASEIFDRARSSNSYIDVHVWRFVPSSFRLIVEDLNVMGKIDLRENAFVQGNSEFFVALSRNGRGPGYDRIELAHSAAIEAARLPLTVNQA